MSRHQATTRRARTRTSVKVRAALAGALVLGVGATATLAAWTDNEFGTATFSASVFDTESSVNGTTFADNATAPGATMTVTAGGFSPDAHRYAFIDVRGKANSVSGTLALSGATVTNNPTTAPTLGGALQYRAVATAPGVACTAAAFTTGTPTFLVGSTASTVALTTAGSTTVPLPAASASAPSTAVRFCFDVYLPINADTALQGKGATATWQITGTSSS